MTIGQVAKRARVGVETIRFYEREGLIAPPPRRPSGYRDYPPETVDRIRFVRRAKALGFSLSEVKELLALRVAPDTTCAQIRERAETKIGDIEDRIASLQRMKQVLAQLADACGGKGAVSECPILDALDGETKPWPSS
jgi:MerR family copper efflux transcriptional regulator